MGNTVAVAYLIDNGVLLDDSSAIDAEPVACSGIVLDDRASALSADSLDGSKYM